MSHVVISSSGSSRLDGWRERWRRIVTPRADGLPNAKVLLAFPLLLLVLGTALVATGLNGTSSGALYPQVYQGRDPDLVAGGPRIIRSDEWNVQTVWAIAQEQQHLPAVNHSFPGGMDATVPQDLPRADWSVAFRPHLLGFLFLDVDQAVALKWWLPALGTLALAYCFVVTLIPRRPVLAAGLAAAFYLSPLLHWWFLQTTWWPAAWGFAVLTSITWALRSRTLGPALGWAAVVAYLTPVMAMGIYVPYIQPIAVGTALTGIGMVVVAARDGAGVRRLVSRLALVAGAGVAGSTVVLAWLGGRQATVEAFLGTTYPGARSFPTGQGGTDWLVWTFSSSFARALLAGEWYGTNPSEASTFFLTGLFLLPVVAWLAVLRWRAKERLPWPAIGASATMLLIFAFEYVPGWDAVARLMLFDQVLPNRLRMGLGFASAVVVITLAAELRTARRPGLILASLCGTAYLASQLMIAAHVHATRPGALGAATHWLPLAVLGAVAIVLLARARPLVATVLLVLIGLYTTVTINPLYRGVFDLRQTAVSRAIVQLDTSEPGATWVGVGGNLTTDLLLESGATGFNGFQGAPSERMWNLVDPTHRYEDAWNRLAGISWVPAPGEPQVSNPYPDQIAVTFDACSAFAQRTVTHVLSDASAALDTTCLEPEQAFDVASGRLQIWRVTPAH